jgi:hypothetical protein
MFTYSSNHESCKQQEDKDSDNPVYHGTTHTEESTINCKSHRASLTLLILDKFLWHRSALWRIAVSIRSMVIIMTVSMAISSRTRPSMRSVGDDLLEGRFLIIQEVTTFIINHSMVRLMSSTLLAKNIL